MYSSLNRLHLWNIYTKQHSREGESLHTKKKKKHEPYGNVYSDDHK